MRAPRGPALLAAAGLTALLVLSGAAPAVAEPAVDVGGTPVEGGPSPSDPTPLETGLWADTLAEADSDGDVRYYSYDRTMADSTVWIGAIAASGDGESDSLEVEVTAEGEETPCRTETVSTSGFPMTFAVFGTSADAGPAEPDERDGACLTSDTLLISVGRYVGVSSTTGLPFALKIVEEAPVPAGSTSDLPKVEDSPTFEPPGAGEQTDVAPGATTLEDAPEVASGSTWTAEVAPGEQQLWRVRLGWGQGLSVTASAPAKEFEEGDFVPQDTVELGLVTPLRATVGTLTETENTGEYGEDPLELATGIPPVAYRARFEGVGLALPGDHWLTVAVEPPDESDEPVVPVELTLEVTGDVTGEPPYAEVVTSPDGGAGPEGYDASTPFLVAAGTFAADPSGNPVIAPDAADDAGSARRWWGAGLGVVSLLVCAAGVWRLRGA